MFVTLISAVSAVAFNAYAALPEDYVYLTVSGIYHCHVGRGSQEYNPPPIVQVRVLTHSFTYDQVDSVDEATHMTYPSIPFNIQKIQGYVNGTLIAEYSTINKDFDPAALEQVPLSGKDLLKALSGTSDSVRLQHVNNSSAYYDTEASFRENFGGTDESPNEISFVIIGTSGQEITVSSLNTNTVFNALLSLNGISADDPDYALTYYKDYTGRRVLATYDVTPSTTMYETSFRIEELEIPVQRITNDDGSVSYLQPTFQVVYEDGGESSIV